MVISPAYAEHYYPTREDNLLICDSYIDASYMIAFFYPILLIVVCTIYAVLTRKIPEAFNESKHIGKFSFIIVTVYHLIHLLYCNGIENCFLFNEFRLYNVHDLCYMVGFCSSILRYCQSRTTTNNINVGHH